MKRLAVLTPLFLMVLSSVLEAGCQASAPPVTSDPNTQFNSYMPAHQRQVLAKRKAAEAAEP